MQGRRQVGRRRSVRLARPRPVMWIAAAGSSRSLIGRGRARRAVGRRLATVAVTAASVATVERVVRPITTRMASGRRPSTAVAIEEAPTTVAVEALGRRRAAHPIGMMVPSRRLVRALRRIPLLLLLVVRRVLLVLMSVLLRVVARRRVLQIGRAHV